MWEGNKPIRVQSERSGSPTTTSVTDGVSTTTYTYSGDGDRVAQTADGVTTTYILDTASSLTMVLAESTTGEDPIYYLHGLDLVAQSDATTTEYFGYDGLGSVRQVFDAAGDPVMTQTFDPYGSRYGYAGPESVTSVGYTGEFEDGNGLLFLRARFYNAASGRFLNMDPSRQEVNPYAYVKGNPVMWVDLSGLLCLNPFSETGVHFFSYGCTYPEVTQPTTHIGSFATGAANITLGVTADGLMDASSIYRGEMMRQELADTYGLEIQADMDTQQQWWDACYGMCHHGTREVVVQNYTQEEIIIGYLSGAPNTPYLDAYDSARAEIVQGVTGIILEVFLIDAIFGVCHMDDATSIRPYGGGAYPVDVPNDFGSHQGASSGRLFFPDDAGGAIRNLNTENLQITSQGIDAVEAHIGRFEPDPSNQAAVARLRAIAAGELEPTQWDYNYYSHELRESVRYRQLGWATGNPLDMDEAHYIWNNTHTATLEDYSITDNDIYHPSIPRP